MKEKIKTHSFPKELAKKVTSRWTTFVVGDYIHPPLPSLPQLQSLMEVAYLASMETEESRPLRFTLCCTPMVDVVRRGRMNETVEVWAFDKDRAFNIQEVRRLAVSANVESSAIWVRFSENPKQPLSIHGLINLGSSWASARKAFTYHYSPLPEALLIRVESPGRLLIYQGQYLIASLRAGESEISSTMSLLDLLGVYPLFTQGHDLLRKKIIVPKHEPVKEWHEFEWMAYVNTILAVVNSIQQAGHGGALILAGRNSNLVGSDFLKVKYKFAPSDYLRKYFIEFMNLRHKFGDMIWLSETKSKNAPNEDEINLLDYQLKEAQTKLSETCTFIGNFSGTDGAVVLQTSLTVEGFSSEILLDRVSSVPVFEYIDPTGRKKTELDSEQFGMRHRSAMRLCSVVPELAVFVVSQDGGISVVWNDKGRVYFKAGARTTNVNMAFT